MDLTNQEKMSDGYMESYDGGYKVVTSELPTEDIVINLSIQKAVVETTENTEAGAGEQV